MDGDGVIEKSGDVKRINWIKWETVEKGGKECEEQTGKHSYLG